MVTPPLEQLGDVAEGSPRQVVGELFGQRYVCRGGLVVFVPGEDGRGKSGSRARGS